MSDSEDVWTRYWSSASSQRGAACLPNALGPIEAAQKRLWRDFARGLRRGARVLDLATGNGIVPRWMIQARPDLKLVGVDTAQSLPAAPKGVTLKAGVAIEALPFTDAAFDAATSQFGIEYGDVGAATRELARVLRPGAPLQLIVHHADGAVVAHNRGRRAALLWTLQPGGLLAKAKAFAAARATSALAVPPVFREAPLEARRRFPDQSVAPELAVAIVQRLEAGREAPSLLDALETEARGEAARIALLEAAARDPARIDQLLDLLRAEGVAMDPASVIPDTHSGRPLAWLLAGIA